LFETGDQAENALLLGKGQPGLETDQVV